MDLGGLWEHHYCGGSVAVFVAESDVVARSCSDVKVFVERSYGSSGEYFSGTGWGPKPANKPGCVLR